MATSNHNGPAREKKTKPHSSFDMIKHALISLRIPGPASRRGVSVQAIKAFVANNYLVDMKTRSRLINSALRKAVASGNLIQTTGPTGAIGCFKLPPTKPLRKIPPNKVSKKRGSVKKPTTKRPNKNLSAKARKRNIKAKALRKMVAQ